MIFVAAVSVAQKDRSKDVETQYLSLPTYDLSQIDPSTITVEFAMGQSTYGVPQMKETESVCKPKGGSIKDAVKITTYYYQFVHHQPASYVVARSSSGEIVYANQASEASEGVAKFGYDKCEYWISDKLKKDWEAQKDKFMPTVHNGYEKDIFSAANEQAKSNVFLSYYPEKFEVYSGKGKLYDYTDMDGAFDLAMEAYISIKEKGINQEDADKLKQAIAVWEKELETEDLEDNKARISKDVSRGLRENCVRAYMHLYDFDNASKHARLFKDTYGNFSNNRSQAMDGLMKTIEFQRIAVEKNADLINDLAALNTKAQSASKNVETQNLGPAGLETLKSDYNKYRATQYLEVADSRKKQEEELVASGELNPYEKYVQDTGITGKAIMFTMAPSALSGFPELTEVPAQMCELTELSLLIIRNNKVETISPDIKKLTGLTKLDLTGNNIKTIPAEIGQLTELKTLNLSKNPLTSIPDEIANCTNLKSLTLKETNLSKEEQEKLERLLPDTKIKF